MRALVVHVNRWTHDAGSMSRVTYGRTVLATLPTLDEEFPPIEDPPAEPVVL